MIEFTMSRVMMCLCGVILLVSVVGVAQGIYDMGEDDRSQDAVERIGNMLDSFESSGLDEMILDGSMILTEGSYIHVHDGFVELYTRTGKHISATDYDKEFELEYGEVRAITRRTFPRS